MNKISKIIDKLVSTKAGIKSVDLQIHEDVYSAQELILTEAQRILSIPQTYNTEKAERLSQLEKLGFDNFDEVKALIKEREDQKKHREINAMLNYYKRVYPLHRFISQDSVQIIIKKYSLLLAKAGDYIAEIPEKNQHEIINFKVLRRDTRDPIEIRTGLWGGMNYPMPNFDHFFTAAERREMKKQECISKKEYVSGSDLLIIAPKHKLDMTNREIKNGILRIKDPIVLQPVRIGYLIVTSWGLEASDEFVFNAINN